MKKAIVFAGGGSKGAYQIGVWKALNELGERFDIAAGTSIGSINAAFYVQDDFEAAYEMWATIKPDDIMANGLNLEKDFGAMFAQRGQIIHFLKEYVNYKGADVTPFHDCLKRFYNAEKFASSPVDYALMATEFPSLSPAALAKAEFLSLTPVTVTKADIVARGENGWEWLAASAAAWPVFPVMPIDGKNYVDGGFYDNVPVAAAMGMGARRVLTVYLRPDGTNGAYAGHPYVDEIRPTRDLGTFLNFDRQVLDRSIRLGYTDTMKHFGKYYGRLFTFIPAKEETAEKAARRFMDILSARESVFRSREKYHFQMGSRDAGCVPLLIENAFEKRNDEKSLFFSALEIYLRLLGFDEETDKALEPLLSRLGKSLRAGNTAGDFEGENAEKNLLAYVGSEADESRADGKATENERMMLVACAMAQTLIGL